MDVISVAGESKVLVTNARSLRFRYPAPTITRPVIPGLGDRDLG